MFIFCGDDKDENEMMINCRIRFRVGASGHILVVRRWPVKGFFASIKLFTTTTTTTTTATTTTLTTAMTTTTTTTTITAATTATMTTTTMTTTFSSKAIIWLKI